MLLFKRDNFVVKTKNYELRGSLDDKETMLLLRDFITRECVTRGYTVPPDEDFIVPYDSDINDMGVTD